MSALHDWERLDDEINTNPFANPEDPDIAAVWRCTKCGFRINSDRHKPMPALDLKYYRKMPGGTEERYNCDEVIVFRIQES